MTENSNFIISDISTGYCADILKATVSFNITCGCGCPICLGDHDRYCRNCGKKLPEYNKDVVSNEISVEDLFDDSTIISKIKEYLKKHEINATRN